MKVFLRYKMGKIILIKVQIQNKLNNYIGTLYFITNLIIFKTCLVFEVFAYFFTHMTHTKMS